MKILGIESTAHTLGIGVCDSEGNLLSNERATYVPKKGGILPRESADFQVQKAAEVLENSLKSASLKLSDIDAFAFAQGPGLGPCLRIGATLARYLSLEYKKPIIGVNHCIAHIEVAKLATDSTDPVVLYVSGGNTQVIAFSGGKYRVFGETLDISIGNAIDTFARELGLVHPGGPKVEKLAEKSTNYIELPYTVKGMDMSFAGLMTECKRKWQSGNFKKEDLCYSMQETGFSMLTEVTERAMAHTEKDEVLVTGGVAANKRLKEMLEIMAKERDAKFYKCPMEYSGDNAIMIAWTGALMLNSGAKPLKIKESEIRPKWRTDDVEVLWL